MYYTYKFIGRTLDYVQNAGLTNTCIYTYIHRYTNYIVHTHTYTTHTITLFFCKSLFLLMPTSLAGLAVSPFFLFLGCFTSSSVDAENSPRSNVCLIFPLFAAMANWNEDFWRPFWGFPAWDVVVGLAWAEDFRFSDFTDALTGDLLWVNYHIWLTCLAFGRSHLQSVILPRLP